MLVEAKSTGRVAVMTETSYRGFTLIELMITVSLVAILLSVAIPSFREVIQNNRAASQANALLAAFNLARAEAVKRGEQVRVCPSSDQATCSGGSDWTVGWIVQVVSSAEVLQVWSAPPAVASSAGPTAVVYLGSGEVTDPALPDLVHKVKGCDGEQARTIDFSATGHPIISATACSEGD
jgi:type IV fimbrial biogenesis protein FimT